ncbi:Zinc finger C2H2-type [Cinara cedri]|uniref:Zinc finger C2H2-type n=1 Tax=Cinara cedri TaxID=506608 RepID=A0A5E4ND59_9HEMI|nr:Zinc finger C2H2-type [Cinara cedri]
MTSDDEDEETGPIHGEKLPRKLSNTCRQCAMGFLSFSELSEHNKTHHYNAAVGLQAIATVADLRNARNHNIVVANNNNNNSITHSKVHEEQRRQRQDAENNNRRYGGGGGGLQDAGDDGGIVTDESAAAMIPGAFPFAAYQAAVAAAAVDGGTHHPHPVAAAPGHHVTLEALQNTKVAVAQFAATAMAINNEAASNPNVLQDLAIVNSTLFTLQHQQMMQLSLIQQLRQQLQISRRSGGGGSLDGTLSVSPPLLSDCNEDILMPMGPAMAAAPATGIAALRSPNEIPLSFLAISRNGAEQLLLQQMQQQQQLHHSPPPAQPLHHPAEMVPLQATGDCTTQTCSQLQPLSRSPTPSSSRSHTPPPPPLPPQPAIAVPLVVPELQRPSAAVGGTCPRSPLQALQQALPPSTSACTVQTSTAAATTPPSVSSSSSPPVAAISLSSSLPYPSTPMTTHHHSIPSCSVSSAFASSIITNLDPPPSPSEPNTLEMLQRRAQEVLDKASQGLLANNLADELSFRKGSSNGKGSSLSPYDGKSGGGGGRSDNFYKHRCRYCGKVFGSDSALQIHIRSHTGERPFKCNVCGSRFTTKGNLKVHFQRHTSKFPNVKMNPLPVPEHLDRDFPALMPPHTGQSPHHQNNGGGSSSQMQNSAGVGTAHSPLSHQFPAASSSPSFPSALSSLFRPGHLQQKQQQHNRSSSADIVLPANIQMPASHQQQPPTEQFLMMNHQQHHKGQHPQQQQQLHLQQTNNVNHHNHSSSSLHNMFQFKRDLHQEQPENLSKPANTCSSRDSSAASSPPPLSESSMTRNNCKDDPASSEYIDDMNVDIDSADADGRQNDIDGNTDDFSVDTKYSGDEERTNSPATNDGQQDQPENLSNKSGRAMMMMMTSPPLITSDESFSPRPTSSSSRHLGSPRPGSPVSGTFNNINLNMNSGNNNTMVNHAGTLGYSPPCALDLTPNQTSALAVAVTNNHIMSAYLQPGFTGLMAAAGPSTSVAGLPGHPGHPGHPGPSFGQSTSRGNTTCNICFKTFACHSALEIHYRSHTKERPFKCTVCERGFSTKGNMKQHMLTHKSRDMGAGGSGGGSSSNNMYDANNSTSCGHDDTASNASSESRDASHHHHNQQQQQHHQHHMHHHQQQMLMLSAAAAAAAAASSSSSSSSSATAVGPAGGGAVAKPLPQQQLPVLNCAGVAVTGAITAVSANASTCTAGTAVQSSSDLSAPPPPPPPAPPAPVPAPPPSSSTSSPSSASSAKSAVPSSHVPLSVPAVGQLYNSGSRKPASAPAAAASDGPTPSSSSSPKRPLADPDAGLPAPKRHSSSPKHLCTVCHKNFSSSSALQIHMRTHTGDKPFRCTVCLKAFTTKGNLKVHMGTHMWTNGTSRRGRRMSLEIPPLSIANSVKDSADFLQRRPEIYYHPFLPSPFLNGIHQQKINEISVIQNVNSNVNNRILGGFGNFGGASFPDMMKQEPGIAADKQMSPPSHHIRTSPLWDLHYDRQPAANVKSAADEHQLNNCAPQSPQSASITHANHIAQNRTEGLAT